MDQLKNLVKSILAKFSKVQLAAIAVLLISCFIISDSNIFTRLGYDSQIRDLEKQINYYREKTNDDKRKLNELRSNKENIEKFARENYFMKKEDEEVFVVE